MATRKVELKFAVAYLLDTGANVNILYDQAIPNTQIEMTGNKITVMGLNEIPQTYPAANARPVTSGVFGVCQI